MAFAQRGLFSIVGESGCGKSTVAAVLLGRNTGYLGSVTVGGRQLRDINEAALMRHITLVSHNSYLFKGTVRGNLQVAVPGAPDEALWAALEKVKLAGFLRAEDGWIRRLPKAAQTFPAAAPAPGFGARPFARQPGVYF